MGRIKLNLIFDVQIMMRVLIISSQHPFNQAYTQATDTNQKGIWQVTPTKHDWD
jgi:hypothetical protein